MLRFLSAPLVLTAIALTGLTIGLQAQKPQQMTMEVSIVATGKDNVPVEDLSAADISIKDNNKKQEILSFEKIAVGGPAVPGKPSLYNIVLLDCLNTTYRDLPENRVEILKVVNQLSKANNLTFLMLRDGLRIVNDSGNQALLQKMASQGVQGLDDPKPNLEPYNWVFSQELGLFQLFTPAGIFDRRRIEDSIGALRTVASNFHGRSGRKNLIWISQGFPITVGQIPAGYDAQMLGGTGKPVSRNDDLAVFAKDMEFTGRMLNNANVAVYPVDSRFLSVDDTKSSDRSTMQDLANETGGVAYLTRKDVATAVGEALNDTKTVYVVRYAISDIKNDGKFHAVKIDTTRKDVKLRARKGYNAPLPPK